jgi:hypothetical protein
MKRTVHVPFLAIACSAAGLLAITCNRTPEERLSTAPTTSAITAPATSASGAPVTSASTAPDASAAAAATPFEGEIAMVVSGDASKTLSASVVFEVKGDKFAYVAREAPVRAIGDLASQRVWAIDDAQGTYDLMDLKASAQAKSAPRPKVRKTGRTENVAGLECEDWTIDDGNENVDVCASKGIPYFDLASDAKPGSAETPWATALTTARAFPLRVVVHDKSGKDLYRVDTTHAVRRKIDDATFLMPSGYKSGDLASETKAASLP